MRESSLWTTLGLRGAAEQAHSLAAPRCSHISEAVCGVQVQLVGVVLLKNPTGAENKPIGTIAVDTEHKQQ